jgi:hypothetical protein
MSRVLPRVRGRARAVAAPTASIDPTSKGWCVRMARGLARRRRFPRPELHARKRRPSAGGGHRACQRLLRLDDKTHGWK